MRYLIFALLLAACGDDEPASLSTTCAEQKDKCEADGFKVSWKTDDGGTIIAVTCERTCGQLDKERFWYRLEGNACRLTNHTCD